MAGAPAVLTEATIDGAPTTSTAGNYLVREKPYVRHGTFKRVNFQTSKGLALVTFK